MWPGPGQSLAGTQVSLNTAQRQAQSGLTVLRTVRGSVRVTGRVTPTAGGSAACEQRLAGRSRVTVGPGSLRVSHWQCQCPGGPSD